jgi:hypothetical protein
VKIVPVSAKCVAPRLAAVSLGLLMMCAPIFGQVRPERFWVAGRYDGNRIVVYFNKVQFGGTMSSKAREIAPPVAYGFFSPVELPASYIAGFQKKPDVEHFAIGDRYDLMLGNGMIATIKLTALVGCETDEEVGNDSFIGALATVEEPNSLLFTQGYYAVRRHQKPQSDKVKPRPKTTADNSSRASDRPVSDHGGCVGRLSAARSCGSLEHSGLLGRGASLCAHGDVYVYGVITFPPAFAPRPTAKIRRFGMGVIQAAKV